MIQCNGIWLPRPRASTCSRTSSKAHSSTVEEPDQLHKIQLALSHTKGRRVALDIGAHVGLISRILAMDFERVEAFEPLPDHRECFAQNVTAENVVLHACALGASQGEVRMRAIPATAAQPRRLGGRDRCADQDARQLRLQRCLLHQDRL